MAGLLRNFFREEPSSTVEERDFSVEYSFAVEYDGPPISHEIPRIVPVKIDYIPTAVAVVSSSHLNDVSSLPVIQPINKKLKRGANSSSLAVISSSSVIQEAEPAYLGSKKKRSSEDECIRKSVNEIDSSGELETSNKVRRRLESGLESLEMKNEQDFPGYMNPTDSESESAKSGLSSSGEIFSVKEEEGSENEIHPSHGRKPSAVTFLVSSSSITSEEAESNQFETQSVQEVPRATRNGKKGTCYRCLKGNRFTTKEVCFVCGAKYCCDCVIRAMGSMPEGRKCLTCIGFSIDESRRANLGKCSKILKKLLIESEVERVMEFELECEVNQLPPRFVYVNDNPLSREELLKLQGCQKPPKKLKPGRYWYDKESGFWGKEGHGPCQIVSPQLEVGGTINKHCSNGNTNVCINGREITKKELLMLKMAGVPCEGRPSFWVSADGTYQEEGMNNEGKIWDKTKTKLVCAVLSLPIPSSSVKCGEELSKKASTICDEQKVLHKLLLVGFNKSGTSTIFKQAKQIYKVPFSADERQTIKFVIQRNLYWYLGILLEGCKRFEEELLLDKKNKNPATDQSVYSGYGDQINCKPAYSIGPGLEDFADWLLDAVVSGKLEAALSGDLKASGPASTHAYLLEELWKDDAIQATYNRRSELEMLPRVASYFLDRAVEIASPDYDPSDNDILYAEGISSCNSLSSMEFSFPESPQDAILDPPYQHDSSLRYELIRANPVSLGKGCKWLEMFEDTDIVLFCAALTDYDEFSEDENGVLVNRMIATRQLFERIVTHPAMEGKNFLLLLNKFDLFEEKINQVPLTNCEWFNEFSPVMTQSSTGRSMSSTNTPLAQRGFQYIGVKFKRLFSSLTGKKLFVSLNTGMEPENVNEALRYAREIIKWQIPKPLLSITEVSSTSAEASTFS